MPRRVMSIHELRRALAAKEREAQKLQRQRTKLANRLDVIDGTLEVLGSVVDIGAAKKRGRPKATRRRRRRARGGSLVQYISKALAKAPEPVRVKNIMKAVQAAGYKSSSKDFYSLVAAALRDTDQFKRTGRGLYTLKK